MGWLSDFVQGAKDLVNPPSVAERIDRHNAAQVEQADAPPNIRDMREDAIHKLRDGVDSTDTEALAAAQAAAAQA